MSKRKCTKCSPEALGREKYHKVIIVFTIVARPVAVAAPEVASTTLYRIRFASANLMLKVDEASAAGSGFVLAAPDTTADQVFFLEARDGGTVAIRSYANPSLYLTAPRTAEAYDSRDLITALPDAFRELYRI